MAVNGATANPNPSENGRPKRLERALSRSAHITLGLACACLAYSEFYIMREVAFFAAIAGSVLLASYWMEGKWTLPIWASNVLGGLIAAFAAVWIAFQMQRPNGGLLIPLSFPTSLLPYLGPILMVLLSAKLFRPRLAGDHWWLQFIGLSCVTLACALAEDAVFGLLLLSYVLSGIWFLSLFYYHCQSKSFAREAMTLPRFRSTIAWLGAITLIGSALFLYTPRSDANWQISGSQSRRMETGLTEDPSIDLSQTGTLELSSDPVFEVYAEEQDGAAKLDLNSNMRWRGPRFRYYYRGRWQNETPGERSSMGTFEVAVGGTRTSVGSIRGGNRTLPNLGAGQYTLTYTLRTRIGPTPFLAQPVIAERGDLPVILLRDRGAAPWFQYADGSIMPSGETLPPGAKYRQVMRTVAEPGLSPDLPFERQNLRALTSVPVEMRPLRDWTMQIVQRLTREGRLPSECLTDLAPDGSIDPRYYEPIAHGLESYLGNSGEFRYTLQLERADSSIDPVLDFLFNTRAGHCNRFATALVLMLRMLGIPSQIVLGYHGVEARGDGYYDVKQCHAHAWVEVLVPRWQPSPLPGMRSGRHTFHWLTLDPTPTAEALAASNLASGRWWTSSQWDSNRLFKGLFTNFSPDNRDQFGKQLLEAIEKTWTHLRDKLMEDSAEGWRLRMAMSFATAILFLLPAIGLQLNRLRRRRRGKLRSDLVFHRRLWKILARRGWRPAPSDTAAEFAARVDSMIAAQNGRGLSAIVGKLSRLYHRVRFGNVPLSGVESQEVAEDLDRLARDLNGKSR